MTSLVSRLLRRSHAPRAEHLTFTVYSRARVRLLRQRL